MTGHGLATAAVPDAGAFLSRLIRLDPGAVVRLRPAGPDAVELWSVLPWEVLVTRTVAGRPAADATVGAADLLKVLAEGGSGLPVRRDTQWRWSLPPASAEVVETVPAREFHRLAAAAADTMRAARGGATGARVGERMLRDRLLDHVAIQVTSGSRRVDVTLRLVQALVRMGFLGTQRAESTTDGSAMDAAIGNIPVESGAPCTDAGEPVSDGDASPAGPVTDTRPESTPGSPVRAAPAGRPADPGVVYILAAPRWVGLAGRFGAVWRYEREQLGLRPRTVRPGV